MDLVLMDDPRHRNFRIGRRPSASHQRPFARSSPTSPSSLDQFADELAQQLEESGGRGETTDFVKGFAEKLPLAVIGKMMGPARRRLEAAQAAHQRA